ncbi:hypothetical protein [Microbacterium sp. MM2322]|uniref:hypothetical protein n=1 Tax=Microbacterium sp. MM2322 TaxID=3157631 RepID=UPI0032D5A1C4
MHSTQPPGSPHLTIKPSGQAFGKGLAYRAAIFFPLVIVAALGLQGTGLPSWAIWTVIGAGLLVGTLAIATMITSVTVDASYVVAGLLLGFEKRTPVEAVTKAVLVLQYEQLGNDIAPTFVAVAGGSKPFLRLSGQVYDAGDLMALTRALGRAEIIDEPLTPQLLEQRHPGVVPLYERRPWMIAWIVIGVVVIFAVAAGVAAES